MPLQWELKSVTSVLKEHTTCMRGVITALTVLQVEFKVPVRDRLLDHKSWLDE